MLAKILKLTLIINRQDVDFMQTVECLRIRQRDNFAEITYKPPTNQHTHTENKIIIKPETNLPINPKNTTTAKQLPANLGMMKLVEVNKFPRICKCRQYETRLRSLKKKLVLKTLQNILN
ncbi:CYTH domain-containing protein [Candidatus Minimicrobia vallesae]|uniref:CYTH domain-containing protein n=1 Tax=Candidatus Minimicrobia vallesae TaxID=2841264 RepID=A0A8F1SAT0_9BACT|nr:CYTH domain-containing protein [Candidatus Minimicrobia vallesae]QWQ31819.1 CYTH domain-containing protein [Candidatus Minimicrobia vallesae]